MEYIQANHIFDNPMHGDVELREGKKYRLLSLFSGCGGMDLGFEGGFALPLISLEGLEGVQPLPSKMGMLPKTAFQTVFANDIYPEARMLWENFFCQEHDYSQDVYHLGSIVDLVKLHKSGTQIFPKDIDIVTGGFPCQDFSLAGKRRGFNSHRDHNGALATGDIASEETRGKLYMWMKEVIEITRPKIFVAENVKGLVHLDDVKDIIQQDFSTAGGDGYIVLPPRVLHAGHYGVAQSRERVIFIGVRRSALRDEALEQLSKAIISPEYDPYPQLCYSLVKGDKTRPSFVTSGAILSLLPEPTGSTDPSHQVYSRAKFMGHHCQGQKEIKLDGLAPTIRSEHHGNIEFRRLSREHGGVLDSELEQGLEERRLTPRECAMIQSFPQNFSFVIPNPRHRGRYLVSPSVAYKAIGNAVPPLMAYHLAHRLESLWPLYFG